jgi:hypothetical protein
MSSAAEPTLKIPKFQWDRLQAALRKNTRDFITDCASYIGTPAKDLLAKVQIEINKDAVPIAFFDTDESPCEAYCLQDRFAMRCRKPALLNTRYCHSHQYPHSRPNIHIASHATKMKKLSLPSDYGSEIPELWLEEKTNRVYNSEQSCVGFYCPETSALTMFVVEDADMSSHDGFSDVSSFHSNTD